MELPRVGDDVGQVGPLGFPAEFAVCFFAGGDGHGGVTGAAAFDADGEVDAGDGADGVEDLAVRMALPVTEIEDVVAAGLDGVEGEQVRAGRQIGGEAGGEVVEDFDLVAGIDELMGDDRADLSGTAGDEQLHSGRILRGSRFKRGRQRHVRVTFQISICAGSGSDSGRSSVWQ